MVYRRSSLELEARMHQYMTTGLSNGGPPLTTVLNGPVNNGIGVTGGKGIVSDVNLLLLQRIHQELKVITKRIIEEDRDECMANNWKFAAMVVDRLCLYIFTAFILLTIAGVLISAPYVVA
ncbi:nicotinic acetylcholine receptor alpha 34E [Aphelenchoides avenae]|nr:nicotinic acetylcholine receptor alpha 34E [Aphelenchus avenae]